MQRLALVRSEVPAISLKTNQQRLAAQTVTVVDRPQPDEYASPPALPCSPGAQTNFPSICGVRDALQERRAVSQCWWMMSSSPGTAIVPLSDWTITLVNPQLVTRAFISSADLPKQLRP